MKKIKIRTEVLTQDAGPYLFIYRDQDVRSSGEELKARNFKKYASCLLLICSFYFSLFMPAFADEIKSRAAVVMDSLTGRILYAKNPDLKLLPASTTKLMTALVVIERANLSDVVTISKRASEAPPTKAGFKEGDKVTIETLLYAALMKSANDAAVALAEGVGGSVEEFVKMMNIKALAIGAHDTRFVNPNGLPEKGQYITAYDLSKIMRQAIKYPVLKEILKTRMAEISTEAGKTIPIRSTNKLLWSDDELLGGKTGYTRQARHCFVCAGERENETIIVALLGAPSRDLLWKESEDLLAFGSKVMGNVKEPVVYMTVNDVVSLTKNSSGDLEAARASYAVGDYDNADGGVIKRAHGRQRLVMAKNKKVTRSVASRKKGGRSHVLMAKAGTAGVSKQAMKNRKGMRMVAKNKKLKGQRLAKRDEDGARG